MDNKSLIERYFSAMRRGAHAEDELIELFADDAVYIEPFTDTTPAVGVEQIRDRLRRGWGSEATARWVCRSPALPGPIEGVDRYRIEEGRITRLEVRIQD